MAHRSIPACLAFVLAAASACSGRSDPGSRSGGRVEPRLVGRWDYTLNSGSVGQGLAHLDLRADGTFEYVSALAMQTGHGLSATRYSQGYRYLGQYRATGPDTLLFYAIGKGKIVEHSSFDHLYERIKRIETKNDSAPDREYRFTLGEGAVTFAATDGDKDEARDLNTLVSGPFYKK